MMDEATFIKLAEGYIKQERYEEGLHKAITKAADEYGQEKDFLGLYIGTNSIMSPVLDALGEDFSYYHYDCNDNFDKFNNGTILADGTHPNVHSLKDLYKFARGEEK